MTNFIRGAVICGAAATAVAAAALLISGPVEAAKPSPTSTSTATASPPATQSGTVGKEGTCAGLGDNGLDCDVTLGTDPSAPKIVDKVDVTEVGGWLINFSATITGPDLATNGSRQARCEVWNKAGVRVLETGLIEASPLGSSISLTGTFSTQQNFQGTATVRCFATGDQVRLTLQRFTVVKLDTLSFG